MIKHPIIIISALLPGIVFASQGLNAEQKTGSGQSTVIKATDQFLSTMTKDAQKKGDIRIKVEEYFAMKSSGEKMTVIDVRTAEESAVVGIPGSLKIPLPELVKKISKIPHDGKVVLVCHSGPRSVIAATTLRILGYDNVYALNGGIHALADVTAKTAPVVTKSAPKVADGASEHAVKKQNNTDEELSELGGDDFSCD